MSGAWPRGSTAGLVPSWILPGTEVRWNPYCGSAYFRERAGVPRGQAFCLSIWLTYLVLTIFSSLHESKTLFYVTTSVWIILKQHKARKRKCSNALPLIEVLGWVWAAKEDSALDKGAAGSRAFWTLPLGLHRAQRGELVCGARSLVPLLFWGPGLPGVTGVTTCLNQLGLLWQNARDWVA